jgi:hypothetical protein
VTEAGDPLEKAPGVKFLRMENNCAVIAIDPGLYRFAAKATGR